MEQAQIVLGELSLLQRVIANPVEQAIPVTRVVQHHGKVSNLVRLNQRQRLEQLVECAKAPGKDDERLAVFDEHHLAHEEVFEFQRKRLIGIRLLFEGQLDVAAN